MYQQALDRAEALFDNRRYDMALGEFQKALEFNPNCSYSHTMVARCIWLQSDEPEKRKQALEHLRRALELNSEDHYALYIYSHALRHMDKPKEALISAKQAIELCPDYATYHCELSACYLALGDLKQARQQSETAISLESGSERVWIQHARVCFEEKKYAECHDALDKALELDPEDLEAHGLKGYYLAHENKFAEAVKYYREALRLNPNEDWAKQGYMDALRARSPVYKILVDCGNIRVPVFYFGHPAVLVVLALAALMTGTIGQMVKFMSPHLLNVMLTFDPEASHALDRQEQMRAKILAGYTVLSWLAAVGLLATNGFRLWYVPVFCLLLGAPLLVTRIFELPEGLYRTHAKVYAGVGIAIGIGAIVTAAMTVGEPWDNHVKTWQAADAFGYLLITFLTMCLFSRRLHAAHDEFV